MTASKHRSKHWIFRKSLPRLVKPPSAKADPAKRQRVASSFVYDRRTTATILGAIFLVPYLVLVLRHRPATYSLSATTEVASIVVHDPWA